MILIYRHLINILFPIIIILIFLRVWFKKEDKNRFKEKLFISSFNITRNKDKKLIWFHTASIGEMKSIIPLIKKLNTNNKFEFLITSVTKSSSKLIVEQLSNEKNVIHRFFPVDKQNVVIKFLEGWSPDLILFVDSEIWPNFLFEIKKKNIPLILLNGRITKKTFLRWKLIPKVAKKIFQTFDLCLTSSNKSKNYLEQLSAKNVKHIGNLKLSAEIELKNQLIQNKNMLKNIRFWCAVSTHPGEDLFCIKTHLNIKKIYNNIVTILIPRHINRSNDIELACSKFNLKSQILSNDELIDPNSEIIIINSYGVISNYLESCKSVFIGKSMLKKLKNVSGQDPIEAAKLSCKIYHGPFVSNFEEIYDLLNKLKISKTIHNEIELSDYLIKDLNNFKKTYDNKISVVDSLGKKILEDTYNELTLYLKNENSKT
ncbi:hypothetical protein IDG78_02920 [Pelagibacterales bacterium SAG-MED05]|nr:hypothetical protein [Pelagibacterales bacterium SAG-MED05]